MSTPLLWVLRVLWCGTKNGSFSIKFFCSSLAVRRTKTFLTHSFFFDK